MTSRTRILFAAVVLASLAVLGGGCRPQDALPPEPDSAVLLRAYEVPAGVDPQQFRDHVQSSLGGGDNALGRAVLYPDGAVVVTAPAGVHNGIAALVASMSARGPRPDPTPPESISLHYWALVARPIGSTGSRATGVLERATELRPALDELARTFGGLEFRLLEQLESTSLLNGASARIDGGKLRVRQRVLRAGSGVLLADVELALAGPLGHLHQLETRVRVEPGRFIVLGQSAYNDANKWLPASWKSEEDVLLYYVITSDAD